MSAADQQVDILISGGGPAGLIAAAAFGLQGYQVLCVDPTPPVTTETDAGADLRSTAFLTPSVEFLDRIGLWPLLAPHATPLRVMRIVDAGGAEPRARLIRDFDASDLRDDQPFGWNLPNWLIRREVMALLDDLAGVRLLTGTGTAGLIARDDAAFVTLGDGTRVRARLVVAADGRNSPVRQALGIGVRRFRYGQKALAFAVTHELPHNNVSTEVHRSGGPFTLVPLPDRDGLPCSAIVWMDRGPEIARLAALPDADFAQALNQRSAGMLGWLTPVTRLSVWPIISQIADRFDAPRVALVAEAAHVVPPIGAQGLNMSLADLAALVDLSADDPGNRQALAAYNRARRPEAMTRLMGIDTLNRASMAGSRPLQDMRAAGLGLLHGIAPLRRLLMRGGMGGR
ncbi:UbiH/UbiF family hydroxylase [Paracoccus tegillarcae]|uniref:2-octaprenyl-6-methoxyphenyl hydroxylase n=1 Tax=Paracoccus tegillarcae TaxID=1529068 RepID=A0A2K9EYV1_9RHOB|nr:UbiH/UbiF family hydroxylase [Paracoccus tegillarcae]AUH34494.1 2-octaprenyl-6-methoxyphenyl hydroxylase [Paracoccus tegillarcae]